MVSTYTYVHECTYIHTYIIAENTQHKLALNIEGYYLTEKPDKLAV